MSIDEEMTPIGVARLKALLRKERMHDALHAGGVDNWEWYSEAYREAFPEEDDDE